MLGCFLVLLLLAPLYESFDRWDGFPKSGNDTVLNLIGTVAFCGLVLVAVKPLPFLLSGLISAFPTAREFFQIRLSPLVLAVHNTIGESPPPHRLSPLRI